MHKDCEYNDCSLVATIFYVTPHGYKSWLCIKHYDRMAAYYLNRVEDGDDEFAIEVVKCNGW